MQAARHLGRPDRLGPGTSKCHCRRHRRRRDGATSPGQAAHRPTRSAGRCHPPQAGDPGGWPTLMCQVLTTRARDQGSRPPPSSWPRPWARTSRHRRPASLLRRARSRHTPLRLIDPWRGASPPAATRGSSAPCSPPPSPPLRSDPVSRAYYQRKRDQSKPPWTRPSSPQPTAA